MIGMTLPILRQTATPTWEPFREFEDLYDRMGRLLQGSFPAISEMAAGGVWSPMADIEETDTGYEIDLDLPGVGKDQVTIDVSANQLTVHGEIKEKERTGVLRRQTRRVGRFDYRWTLPADAEMDNIKAELTNGVLSLHIPKAETSKHRRIPIGG